MTLFFVLSYTPSFNSNEHLNNDLKKNINKKCIPPLKGKQKSHIKSYLRLLKNHSIHVQNVFEVHNVKYAT